MQNRLIISWLIVKWQIQVSQLNGFDYVSLKYYIDVHANLIIPIDQKIILKFLNFIRAKHISTIIKEETCLEFSTIEDYNKFSLLFSQHKLLQYRRNICP